MEWIGQHIWSFISRFRSDVYLEASVNPAADVDKFLVQDTNGKVGFRTGAEVLSDIGGSSNIFGDYIRLLPSDFTTNADGGNTKHGVGYSQGAGSGYGLKSPHNNIELFAFVSIPQGMKATHVEVFGLRPKAVEVFEVQINATTVVSKGSGTCGIGTDSIGDEEFAIGGAGVNSTATNLLAIEVDVISVSADRVYGGRVKIAQGD